MAVFLGSEAGAFGGGSAPRAASAHDCTGRRGSNATDQRGESGQAPGRHRDDPAGFAALVANPTSARDAPGGASSTGDPAGAGAGAIKGGRDLVRATVARTDPAEQDEGGAPSTLAAPAIIAGQVPDHATTPRNGAPENSARMSESTAAGTATPGAVTAGAAILRMTAVNPAAAEPMPMTPPAPNSPHEGAVARPDPAASGTVPGSEADADAGLPRGQGPDARGRGALPLPAQGAPAEESAAITAIPAGAHGSGPPGADRGAADRAMATATLPHASGAISIAAGPSAPPDETRADTAGGKGISPDTQAAASVPRPGRADGAIAGPSGTPAERLFAAPSPAPHTFGAVGHERMPPPAAEGRAQITPAPAPTTGTGGIPDLSVALDPQGRDEPGTFPDDTGTEPFATGPNHTTHPQTRAATALPVAAERPAIASQLGNAILSARDGMTELRLVPGELGAIRFRLHSEAERLVIVISADRPETLALMRRHADDLSAELRGAGYERIDLSFGGQADSSAEGWNGPLPDPQAGPDTAPHPATGAEGNDAAPHPDLSRRPPGPGTSLYLRL